MYTLHSYFAFIILCINTFAFIILCINTFIILYLSRKYRYAQIQIIPPSRCKYFIIQILLFYHSNT